MKLITPLLLLFYTTLVSAKSIDFESDTIPSPKPPFDRSTEHPALQAHLFLGSNNFELKPGRGYFNNSLLVYNHARIGITRNISMAAGGVPLRVLGAPGYIFWGAPKVQFERPGKAIHWGGGGLYTYVQTEEDNWRFGFGYVSGTYGNRKNNITFGVGTGFENNRFFSLPMFMLSGVISVSPRVSVILETYQTSVFDGWATLSGAGVRIHFRGVSLDAGAVGLSDTNAFLPLPWVSAAVPFGKR